MKWSSEDIETSFIDPFYFYTKTNKPMAKITEFDTQLFNLGELMPNENCFYESNFYKA